MVRFSVVTGSEYYPQKRNAAQADLCGVTSAQAERYVFQLQALAPLPSLSTVRSPRMVALRSIQRERL